MDEDQVLRSSILFLIVSFPVGRRLGEVVNGANEFILSEIGIIGVDVDDEEFEDEGESWEKMTRKGRYATRNTSSTGIV